MLATADLISIVAVIISAVPIVAALFRVWGSYLTARKELQLYASDTPFISRPFKSIQFRWGSFTFAAYASVPHLELNPSVWESLQRCLAVPDRIEELPPLTEREIRHRTPFTDTEEAPNPTADYLNWFHLYLAVDPFCHESLRFRPGSLHRCRDFLTELNSMPARIPLRDLVTIGLVSGMELQHFSPGIGGSFLDMEGGPGRFTGVYSSRHGPVIRYTRPKNDKVHAERPFTDAIIISSSSLVRDQWLHRVIGNFGVSAHFGTLFSRRGLLNKVVTALVLEISPVTKEYVESQTSGPNHEDPTCGLATGEGNSWRKTRDFVQNLENACHSWGTRTHSIAYQQNPKADGMTPDFFWLCQMNVFAGFWATPWSTLLESKRSAYLGASRVIEKALGIILEDLCDISAPNVVIAREALLNARIRCMYRGRVSHPPYAVHGSRRQPGPGEGAEPMRMGKFCCAARRTLMSMAEGANDCLTKALDPLKVCIDRNVDLIELDKWLIYAATFVDITSGNGRVLERATFLAHLLMESLHEDFSIIGFGYKERDEDDKTSSCIDALLFCLNSIFRLDDIEKIFVLFAVLRGVKVGQSILGGASTAGLDRLLQNEIMVLLV